MNTLGQKIREIRQQRDLSLRELASRIDVSPAFMSDVELGRRNLSDKHLREVAAVLQIPLEDLKMHDSRPPLREFQRVTLSDPAFGVAFRQIMDRKISSEELLDFIRDRDAQQEGENS